MKELYHTDPARHVLKSCAVQTPPGKHYTARAKLLVIIAASKDLDHSSDLSRSLSDLSDLSQKGNTLGTTRHPSTR